jgi:predicted membrane protein
MRTLLLMGLVSLVFFAIYQRVDGKDELKIIKLFCYYGGWFFALMAILSIFLAFLNWL